MKVECIKSGVPLFLKSGKEEEFYARIGPGSSKLGGSKLIERDMNGAYFVLYARSFVKIEIEAVSVNTMRRD